MTSPDTTSEWDLQRGLTRYARLRGLRALAWSGDVLYASRGYELLRAQMQTVARGLNWQSVGQFHASPGRRVTVLTRLTCRLLRDGFHALAVHPSGAIVGAVPGAIVTLGSDESEFHCTHVIRRGTRPLHFVGIPNGTILWGEYFDNPSRAEVHIYESSDAGQTWNIAYRFPKGAIRHIHNLVYDSWEDCVWILTGDYGDECRILRASSDFSRIEPILQGKQQNRSAAALPCEDGLYFSSDTPLETNHVYRLDRQGRLTQLAPLSGSSTYGCRVGSQLLFSTMIEPSEINRDRMVRVFRSQVNEPKRWEAILSWRKDRWPSGLFQYGNAFFPDGINTTPYLALTTIAVEAEDMTTSIYATDSLT